MIKLLVDSGSDLSKDFLKNNNIGFLPFYVSYKQKNIISDLYWTDLSPVDYLEDIKINMPEISQPPMMLWYTQLESYLKEGYDILYLAISKELSGGVKIFNIAKNLLKEKYSNKIEVIDTGHVSSAVYLIVQEALRNIRSKNSFQSIISNLESYKNNITFYTTASSFKYYLNCGRSKCDCPEGRPLIKMVNGKLIPQGFYSTQEEALEQIENSYRGFEVEKCIATSWDLPFGDLKYGPTVSAVCGPESINYAYIKKS